MGERCKLFCLLATRPVSLPLKRRILLRKPRRAIVHTGTVILTIAKARISAYTFVCMHKGIGRCGQRRHFVWYKQKSTVFLPVEGYAPIELKRPSE